MSEQPGVPIDELIARGLYDPESSDADYRLRLIGRVLRRGGTIDDIAEHIRDLESLASRLQLRNPRAARHTFREVAEAAGISLEDARRINRAGGFPDPDPDARVFDDEDVELFISFTIAGSMFGEELMMQLSRVMGWAMSRVAEAMLSIFASYAGERSQTEELGEEEFATANEAAIGMLSGAVRAMDIMLRRHMEARSRREDEVALGAEWQGLDTLDRTIGFCDLVGYTELSERLSTMDLAELLERFERSVADVVVKHGGSVVKLIGDEVMFVVPDSGSAQVIALDLVGTFGSDGLPDVRVGIASGRVILREADYFGSVVNLAARIVKQAEPGCVLAPASFKELTIAGVAWVDAGSAMLKGFDEPVELVALHRS